MELNISVTNDALIIPVGIATTPIPIREIIEAKTFPQTVIGTISPYPTVASETVAHQIDAVMLENTSGCASFSRKYIADAENRIVSKERNKVKYNSFFWSYRFSCNPSLLYQRVCSFRRTLFQNSSLIQTFKDL